MSTPILIVGAGFAGSVTARELAEGEPYYPIPSDENEALARMQVI